MPAWMALLHGAVSDTSVPHYVRLFLTKAVLHVDKRHVARAGGDPALQALLAPPVTYCYRTLVLARPSDSYICYFLVISDLICMKAPDSKGRSTKTGIWRFPAI